MSNAIIRTVNLCKSYDDAGLKVEVLKNLSFAIQTKETIAIVGSSGAGKSTLLHCLGGLDLPTSGEVWINQYNNAKMSEKKRCQLRNRYFGFVYQFHHLLAEFSALENIAMPLLIGGMSKKAAAEKSMTMLDKVGLAARARHKPAELSGGEKQRVAIARALINSPLCVFADEPTGNLDKQTAEQVFQVMLELNQSLGTALVMVTHDQVLASRMQRRLVLEAGTLREL